MLSRYVQSPLSATPGVSMDKALTYASRLRLLYVVVAWIFLSDDR